MEIYLFVDEKVSLIHTTLLTHNELLAFPLKQVIPALVGITQGN